MVNNYQCNEEYNISFIPQDVFEKHVENTINAYKETLNKIDLKKFNSNIIDPIKLTFDKSLFRKSWEETIELEIHRQRDKTNNNAIGYFHQNLFRYIKNCIVPKEGFDVIYTRENGTHICVEMKNKHNTMNANSSQKTYINMQNHLIRFPNDECYLVEVLAPKSRNITWEIMVDKKHCSCDKIRRVSIDQFYKIVTGIDNAFYQICSQLPKTIDKLIRLDKVKTVQEDTVIFELRKKNPNLLKALYLLAFESYLGFEDEIEKLNIELSNYSSQN